MSDPRIIAIGTSTPQLRMTQEQAFRAAGYKTERIRKIFLNSDIASDISMVGLGCAGALPTLQRVTDFVRANLGRPALMLAVEICSACYYVDHTLEAVIGKAICATVLLRFSCLDPRSRRVFIPRSSISRPFLDSERIDEVGLRHRDGRLRIVLGESIQNLAGPMIEKALQCLLQRHGLSQSLVRFWVVHPGGRKVIDRVQKQFRMSDDQLRFSRSVLRNYGNVSSPTVMFVLNEIVNSEEPQSGDRGVMMALGPGMAAEVGLLRW